jgi:hypothetical protein
MKSDGQLQLDIAAELEHDWSERELATNTAWRSPGVRRVVDNITLSY